MTIDISNNAARVNYTVAQGVTQTSFSVPFEFFNDADLSVYVDDVLKAITTHYTVSGGDGSTGTITMSVTGASGGSTVVISRSIAIERTSDFVTGVDINRAALNTQLDTLTAIAADNKDKASRSISAPNSEVNPQLELPDADTRKGKLVGFNETTGNVELSATLADGNTLASISGDIATLADIEDGTDATDAIQTVAGISANVTTVAGISANVTSVAGNASNINTVAADGADIGTVAGSIASVNTNAANITDIQNASANAATATTKAAEAATSATNAATSETNAATSETNAATSASTATTQAGISTTKAGEAAASAAAALVSEGAASTSETNAANSAANSSNSATLSEASRIASVAAQAAAETAETNAETAETNAAASAASASTSESNASTSETNAASSAATAATQAGVATTSAGEAVGWATVAASSASSAQASKDAALAALDSFDDRYLGQKAADPTVDNDGDALVSGALYFNTTDDIMKVYDGSLWVAAYASLSGAMFGANNLSDVASISASRTTLGLGTGDTPTFAGINTTGNATFGDNDKAIFGDGSDLQIYHDGSNSRIVDGGTGSLVIQATNFALNAADNSDNFLTTSENAGVTAYYNGAAKLATTSTGIDVTGTVTADGVILGNNDKLIFQDSGGANRNILHFDTGNNIIIGGAGAGVNDITLKNNGAKDRLKVGVNGDISFYEDTGTTPKFFWDASAESLGIGTSSPTNVKLQINGSLSGTAGTGHLAFGEASAPFWNWRMDTSTADLILDRSYGGWQSTPVISFDRSSGNVGIGTSSPSDKLTLDSGQMRLSDNYGIRWGAASTAIYGSAGAGTLQMYTNSSEAMRIDSSGNLLVGKTVTTYNTAGISLYAGGAGQFTASGNRAMYLNRLSTDGDILQFDKDGTTVGSIGTFNDYMTVGSGDTGLLMYHGGDVIRPHNMSSNSARDNAIDLGSSSDRFKDAHFSGTVNAANFNTTSDATLKTNVETLSGSLDAVKSLRGVSFDWLENGGSEIGVIAQEVEAVLPDVVSTNDEGIKSVKYGNMVAVLIEAIKEQQAQIDELKAKLGE